MHINRKESTGHQSKNIPATTISGYKYIFRLPTLNNSSFYPTKPKVYDTKRRRSLLRPVDSVEKHIIQKRFVKLSKVYVSAVSVPRSRQGTTAKKGW